MIYQQLEATIKQHMLLEDPYILKLLCATVIANRLPELDPTWLYIISNSSGGKSELLSALSYAEGCKELDDLTTKTLISGQRGAQGGLLFRLGKNPILLIKDLTLLLDKDSRESGEIFSQLRLVYDGKLNKSFGTGEDISSKIKVGLIAGTTAKVEDTDSKQASLGQRAIRYYMRQPDRKAVTKVAVMKKNKKSGRKEMGEAFKAYLDNPSLVIPTKLPDFPESVIDDIVDLAEMATKARSAVKRKEYDRNNRIERNDLDEMPTRMAEQLKNLGFAFMVMNGGELTNLDNKILYQIALDSIPSERKKIMEVATRYQSITLEGLAQERELPEESVKYHLDELIAKHIITRVKGYGTKFNYQLREDYRQLMAKFEDLEMTDKALDVEPEQPDAPLPEEPAAVSWDQIGQGVII